MNSLPWPMPSLRTSTVPPCISTRVRTRVSPIPNPPSGRSSDWSPWMNRSKMLGQQLGRDADARVAHPQDDLVVESLGIQGDLAAVRGVLGGVVQQIRHNLLEPAGSASSHDRLARASSTVSSCRRASIERAGNLDGVIDRIELSSTVSFRSSILPRVIAGDVEQVVDQAGHVPDLALDDRESPVDVRRVDVGRSEDQQGIQDRSQRVAQLVGQHGEEFVLAAVGLLGFGAGRLLAEPRLLGLALAVGDVLHGQEDHLWVRRPSQ